MKDHVNTIEAAAHIGFSVSTLEYWRQNDKGPKYSKVSGKIFYKLSDLDKWVKAGGDK